MKKKRGLNKFQPGLSITVMLVFILTTIFLCGITTSIGGGVICAGLWLLLALIGRNADYLEENHDRDIWSLIILDDLFDDWND